MARCWFVYGGTKAYRERDIQLRPVTDFLDALPELLA